MYTAGHTLEDVETWWETQEFKLGIPRWMGNCCGCYLKSRGRLEMVAEEEPDLLKWWEDTEQRTGNRFRNDRDSYKGIRLQVLNQGRLWDDDGTSIPCTCTD